MMLLPQAHGVAVERPTCGVRAAAAVSSDGHAAMRCLLFVSIQQGTQYCEECFLQVLSLALGSSQMRTAYSQRSPCSQQAFKAGASSVTAQEH